MLIYLSYRFGVDIASGKYFGLVILILIAFWLFVFLNKKTAFYLLIILIPFSYVIKILMTTIGIPYAGIFGAYKDLMIIMILFSILAKVAITSSHTFKASKLHWPIIMFLLAAIFPFLTTLISYGLLDAFLGLRRTIIYVLMFFLVLNVLKDRDDVIKFSNTMFVIGFLLCLGGILQLLFFRSTLFHTSLALLSPGVGVSALRPTSIFHGPPEFATFTAYFSGFFLAMSFYFKNVKWRRIFTVLLVVSFLALAFSFTRSAWGAFVLACMIWGLLKPKIAFRRIGLIAIIVTILAIIFISNPLIVYRFSQIFDPEEGSRKSRSLDLRERYAITKIKDLPSIMLGQGYVFGLRSAVMVERDKSEGKEVQYIHNFYLQLYWEMGLFGLISFIWLLAAYLALLFKTERLLKDEYLKGIANGLIVATITYIISLFFNPLTFTMASIFFAFAGIAVLMQRIAISEQNQVALNKGIIK